MQIIVNLKNSLDLNLIKALVAPLSICIYCLADVSINIL